jgi:hypothetical protein
MSPLLAAAVAVIVISVIAWFARGADDAYWMAITAAVLAISAGMR